MERWKLTMPKLIVILLVMGAIGFAFHAWSKAQPTADFSGDLHLATPNIDAGFTTEVYDLDTSEVSPAEVRGWLELLRAGNDGSAVFAAGIANLERLYTAMVPDRPALFPNYPNPCNPETWIPYQLAEASDVKVSIYASDGRLVRRLVLGYQAAGTYRSHSRAAYWDGRNEVDERVASGIYFYTLQAGDFTATQKLLIRK